MIIIFKHICSYFCWTSSHFSSLEAALLVALDVGRDPWRLVDLDCDPWPWLFLAFDPVWGRDLAEGGCFLVELFCVGVCGIASDLTVMSDFCLEMNDDSLPVSFFSVILLLWFFASCLRLLLLADEPTLISCSMLFNLRPRISESLSDLSLIWLDSLPCSFTFSSCFTSFEPASVLDRALFLPDFLLPLPEVGGLASNCGLVGSFLEQLDYRHGKLIHVI